MTRQEFIDEVNDFADLKCFCDENRIGICDDVYDDQTYNDIIDEDMLHWVREDHWWELMDRLNDLPSGYDWYVNTDYGWEGADFNDFKDEVLDEMDRRDDWDCDFEEDEDEEYDEDDEEYDDDSDSDFSFDEAEDDQSTISAEVFFCVLKEAV